MILTKYFNWISKREAHHRQYIALALTAVLFFCTYRHFSTATEIILCWSGYTFTLLAIMWITILVSHPKDVKRIAGQQDTSRTLIFLFIIGSASVSVLVVILLLQSGRGQSDEALSKQILLSVFSVVSSWWLVHTVFLMRYAHIYYYGTIDAKTSKPVPQGLDFPNEKIPDYLDFAYFSFVIGMTFQVSDVEITSRKIRRLAWIHGLISFLFNTVILALSINIISGIMQQ